MFGFTLGTKRHSIGIGPILLALTVLLASARLAEAGTGTIEIRVATAGVVLGVNRASGTLHFQGHDYPLSVGGLTAGTVGGGVTRLRGHAYHLRSPADIVGTYRGTAVSLAVAGGRKVVRLHKLNSVVYLHLKGTEAGLELSAAVGGVSISLE
jgi:hypothetical protein